MQKWTLKSIINEAKNILDSSEYIAPDAVISATVSLKENETVHFSLRLDKKESEEILPDSYVYAHGSTPEELLQRFAFELSKMQLPKEPINDFPYEHE